MYRKLILTVLLREYFNRDSTFLVRRYFIYSIDENIGTHPHIFAINLSTNSCNNTRYRKHIFILSTFLYFLKFDNLSYKFNFFIFLLLRLNFYFMYTISAFKFLKNRDKNYISFYMYINIFFRVYYYC